nr:DUF5009 domain-containing protein [Haliscomenobacter sp.]
MTPPSTGQRLYSLDALRGFDMFWIMGAEAVIHSLATATGSPIWEAAAHQLSHPDWNGFRLYDLIFPLFLFLAGVATPYSVGRDLENGNPNNNCCYGSFGGGWYWCSWASFTTTDWC